MTKKPTMKDLLAGTAELEQKISELQKNTAELRARETRLLASQKSAQLESEREKIKTDTILAALGDALSIQDTEFRVLYQNDLHKEIIGDHHWEYCYAAYEKNDRICDGCPVARSFADDKIHTTIRSTKINNETRHIEVTASPLKNANGEIIAGIEIVRDITQRIRQDEELHKAHAALEDKIKTRTSELTDLNKSLKDKEKLLQAVIESTDDGILAVDENGRILLHNQRFTEIWKIPEALRETRDDRELIDFIISNLKEPQAFLAKLKQLYHSKTIDFDTLRFKNNRILERYSRPLIKEEKIVGRVWSFRDITERRKTEKALKESEKHYRTLFEGSRDAIYITSRDGLVIDINQATLNLFGFTREETIGRKIFEIYVDPADRLRFQQEVETNGFVKDFELQLRHRSGSIMDCLVNATLWQGENDAILGYQGIIRDVTEERRVQSQVRQALKMEAIGTLAGGIAHDFNNLLAAILGFVDLANDDIADGISPRTNLFEIYKAGNRAKNLVQQILAFSHQTEPTLAPTLPGVLAEDTLKLLRASIPTTIRIQRKIYHCGLINADPSQIQLVLVNLCTNAFHAMAAKGGILSIGLDEVTLTEDALAGKPDIPTGQYARFTVSDTGDGIDESTMERIFDPYFTTKGQGKGTGLGLSAAHGIVKNHHGLITVHSKVGQGTTFEVFLPIISDITVQAPEAPEPLPTGNERIIFVDDEEILVQATTRILQRLGYETTIFTSSNKALAAFQAEPEKFDLLITDQTMGEITGLELAAAVLKIRPDLPIILCTGYSEEADEATALQAGIKAFLQKPITRRKLAMTIRAVLTAPRPLIPE